MSVALLFSSETAQHLAGVGHAPQHRIDDTMHIIKSHDAKSHILLEHPESPSRLNTVVSALYASGYANLEDCSRLAHKKHIMLCHTSAYYDLVQKEVRTSRILSTGNMAITSGSLQAARYAVGVVLEAVDRVAADGTGRVFCIVRPPGHHATRDAGMGFCLFNNVAIGARYAQSRHGMERILIIDWDVHHGNGTQDIFYSDPNVFYFSIHQSDWYPRTGLKEEIGIGAGVGTTENIPLPAGTRGNELIAVFTARLAVIIPRFRPTLTMISAGFDARKDDPFGRFDLDDEDFRFLTRIVVDLADRYSNGAVISVLEGGYDLEGLTSSIIAHVSELYR